MPCSYISFHTIHSDDANFQPGTTRVPKPTPSPKPSSHKPATPFPSTLILYNKSASTHPILSSARNTQGLLTPKLNTRLSRPAGASFSNNTPCYKRADNSRDDETEDEGEGDGARAGDADGFGLGGGGVAVWADGDYGHGLFVWGGSGFMGCGGFGGGVEGFLIVWRVGCGGVCGV